MVSALACRSRGREFESHVNHFPQNQIIIFFISLSFLFIFLNFEVKQCANIYWKYDNTGFAMEKKPNFFIFQNGKFVGWLVVLRINVDLAIFQPYLDLEAGDNQSLKIQVARRGIEPRSSCSTSQELNHSATAAPSKWQIPHTGAKQDTLRGYQAFYSRYNAFIEMKMTLHLMTNTI